MNICAINKCLVNFCEAANRGKPIVMCFGAYSSFFFFFFDMVVRTWPLSEGWSGRVVNELSAHVVIFTGINMLERGLDYCIYKELWTLKLCRDGIDIMKMKGWLELTWESVVCCVWEECVVLVYLSSFISFQSFDLLAFSTWNVFFLLYGIGLPFFLLCTRGSI